jgi:hypothetical protein
MDVELSHKENVSIKDPSSIDLESSMDQNWQSLDDNVSNKVLPIRSTTTHVSKTSQLYILMFQELRFTKFRKYAVLENVELNLVSGGNGNEEIDILVLHLAPHNVLRVKLKEEITMCEEKENQEVNKLHVLLEVSHVLLEVSHVLKMIRHN